MHPFLFRLPALGVGLLLLGLRIHAAAPAVPIAPAPGIPALLQDAMKNSAMHEGHWAFTQTDLVDVKVGKETKQQQTVFRFDPSKPYAEQFTPQLVEGHPPTAADLKKYRQKGEDRAKDLEKQQKEKERLALKNAGKLEPEGEAELRKYVDVDHISLLAETATEATYAIPMRKGLKAGPLKLEKLELVIRISTADRVLTGLTNPHARALITTLLSAECVGVARWATDTAAGYAKIREQFGRPIGQFQAIKHKCANKIGRAHV